MALKDDGQSTRSRANPTRLSSLKDKEKDVSKIFFFKLRNSNFEGLVTLTLTFDSAIPHTVVHHSSTCTYIPNFMEIGRKKISKVNTVHSKSRDTKTRANIKNPARSNLDIVP